MPLEVDLSGKTPSEVATELEKPKKKKPGPKPGFKMKKTADPEPAEEAQWLKPSITMEEVAANNYTELLRTYGFRAKIQKQTHDQHIEALADKAIYSAKIFMKRLEKS